MRKLIFWGLVILFCMPLAAYAASIGGVETQGKGKLAIGLDQEFVFDRDMKDKTESYQEDPDGAGPIPLLDCNFKAKSEIDKMYRTMVKANYGVLDNLDVYLKLGTADFEAKSNYVGTWSAGGLSDILEEGCTKIKGDNTFAYGFGMKGTYHLENGWIIGCDLQYLRHKNDLKGTDSWTEYEYDDEGNRIGEESFSSTLKGDVTVQEWQVAPYIAKKIGNFLPYFGVKYSSLETKVKGKWEGADEDEWKEKFRADDHFGVFLGTDYKIGENWKFNIEGRFVDETAMSFGATYRF